jgi:hypothetical protein
MFSARVAGRGRRIGIALAAVDLKGSEEEPTTFTGARASLLTGQPIDFHEKTPDNVSRCDDPSHGRSCVAGRAKCSCGMSAAGTRTPCRNLVPPWWSCSA